PLAASDSATSSPRPQTTTSAAIRKSSATSGTAPRKSTVLGGKRKLGAKKVTAELLDFDEAEKKAKEDAERIAKLGYDPDEDTPPVIASAQSPTSAVISPTPANAPTAG